MTAAASNRGEKMATSSMSSVIQHLRKTMCLQDEAGMSDAQLMERFIEHRDEAAFAAVVRRHGSMVMGVCLRVVRNHQDAEDAFQATFLVLVRKAASIKSRELLANWLYGVAFNTALKAKASNVKRQAKEKQVTMMPDPSTAGQQLWNDDLQALLDQELNGLPEKYRVPIILCDLEGKTRKEAAEQLACPEGSLSSRLSRAKVMLAKRLARHGLAVSGGSLGAVLSQVAASACVPTSVMSLTIQAATLFAAGKGPMISVNVIVLTQGVLKAMFMTRLKMAIMVLCAMSVVGLGGGFALHLVAGEPVRLEQILDQPKPNKSEELEKQAVPKKEDGEPKSRSVPLSSIWALRMPGTRPLDITTTDDGKYLTPEGKLVGEIRGALRFDPKKRPLGKEGFAVVGTEMDAVKEAHAVLVKGQKQKTMFQPDDKISLVFFSYQFGSYVHVRKVTQQGHKINVMYEFVPHETKEVTEHLAIIPIHYAGPGNVHVTLTPSFDKLKEFGLDPKEYEKKWEPLIVSSPYSFEIREKK